MPDSPSRSKQISRTLLIVFLIAFAAVLTGIGMAFYYVRRYGEQMFQSQPTFGETIKMGLETPRLLMSMSTGTPWLLVIVSVVLIVVGATRTRLRFLAIVGVVLPALFWVFMSWSYWSTALHR